MIAKIRKRDGRVERFDPKKVESAIHKAFLSAKRVDSNSMHSSIVAEKVLHSLEERFRSRIPGTEDMQNAIEKTLVESRFSDVAKAYILSRQKRESMDARKPRAEAVLTPNALAVLEKRYLLKDESGNVVESPKEMFRRVAKAVAAVEKRYGSDAGKKEEEFCSSMTKLDFLPNSPTLMNAGTPLAQLSACFVLPVEDTLKSIFDAVAQMAVISQSGGGCGFDFSRLRPKGDMVKSTNGAASGPVSFMRVFDTATDVIKQGGKRRGANMGVLRCDHPDIIEFITSKSREDMLKNFNISVAVTDEFMEKVLKKESYSVVNPRTGKPVKKFTASEILSLIISSAHRTGDPGIIFIDEVNRNNPLPSLGRIETTNPCGEAPLLPYESCNLGSVNLSNMVCDGETDWEKIRQTVHLGVNFLDNVIDANRFPLKEIEKMTKANRKIGLGVMGFADMLVQLGIPYDSEKALQLAERIMKFVTEEARKKSAQLAVERGDFPNFSESELSSKYEHMRNATVTAIAPTGTISIIAGCTSGIEPLFAVAFARNVMSGQLLEVNRHFEEAARSSFYSEHLMEEIARTGSLKGLSIPPETARVFVTALDIAPEWHVRMQAAFQKYTDMSVSKTVNLPASATVADVEKAFMLAWRLKCKGITIYRYGSKKEQVLYLGASNTKKPKHYISADVDYAGGCPTPYCEWA